MTRFWMRLAGVSLISAASVAGAQSAAAVAIPATPAGGALRAWYNAYNAGDSAAIQAFLTKYQSPIPSAVMLANRRNSGGLELIKVLVDQPRHIEFVARQKSSDLNVRGTIALSDGEPGTLTQIAMRAISPGAPLEGCKTYDPPPTTTNGAANPKDVASEDAILHALYEVISGPACQHRDWDRFRSHSSSRARVSSPPVSRTAKQRHTSKRRTNTRARRRWVSRKIGFSSARSHGRVRRSAPSRTPLAFTNHAIRRTTRSRLRAASTAFSC